MSTSAFAGLLGMLFVTPLTLPTALKLWMFLPLALCVALVYRATRARTPGDLPRATLITFLSIVAGMVAIAAGAYVLHLVAIRFWA